MQIAALLVDDRIARGGRVHHVEVVVTGERGDVLRPGPVTEQVDRAVAIRQEVHGVADPHRRAVVAVGPRQLFDGAIGKVDQPDRTRAPAAIVAPQAALVLRPVGREAEPDLLVGDATAVRRIAPAEGSWHRQHFRNRGDCAVGADRHRPEPEDGRETGHGHGVACRCEEHAAPVRTPAARGIDARMEGEARRFAAGHRHDVDVGVAADRRREGETRSVRREPRIDLGARRRRQPPRLSAAAGHGPQVAAVFERDQLAADGRTAQQSRALRQRGVAEREHREDGQHDRTESYQVRSCGPTLSCFGRWRRSVEAGCHWSGATAIHCGRGRRRHAAVPDTSARRIGSPFRCGGGWRARASAAGACTPA